MSGSVSKLLLVCICLFVIGANGYSQQTFWEKLIPRYGKVQFAGSMGMLSVGTGWDYGKNHWETDLLLGFVPKESDRKTMLTCTLKQNYIPWKISLRDHLYLDILTSGFYINIAFADRLWLASPDYYPDRYYTFSTKVRAHIFLGERITLHLDKQKWKMQSVAFFYELSASDIYIETAFKNRSIKPKDYLSLSFGIKIQVL